MSIVTFILQQESTDESKFASRIDPSAAMQQGFFEVATLRMGYRPSFRMGI